jgi:hypothetical protein
MYSAYRDCLNALYINIARTTTRVNTMYIINIRELLLQLLIIFTISNRLPYVYSIQKDSNIDICFLVFYIFNLLFCITFCKTALLFRLLLQIIVL